MDVDADNVQRHELVNIRVIIIIIIIINSLTCFPFMHQWKERKKKGYMSVLEAMMQPTVAGVKGRQ